MKKLFLLILVFVVYVGYAQNKASKLIVNKSEMEAIQSEFNFDAKLVKAALEQKFKDIGIKVESSKGIYNFKETILEEFNNEKTNLIISIETQGKNENPSILNLAIIKDNEMVRLSDTTNLKKYGVFFDKFKDYVKVYKHNLDLENKKIEIANVQKEVDNLIKVGESLNSSIQKNTKDLESNSNDQQRRLTEYESKKKTYDEFIAKTTISEMKELGIDVKKKEKVVSDAKKEYDKTVKEGEKLQKEKEKLTSDLAVNGKNQELKKAEVEKLNRELEELNANKP